MKFSILLMVMFLFASCNSKNNTEEEIARIMQNQQSSWNEGDLEAYMQPYWNSDSLIFIGSNGISYGWKTTLNNYSRAYPDKERMGQLLFENEVIKTTGDESAMVAGKWNLIRKSDTLKGSYLLVWQKINGEWKITADHSS